MRPAPLLTIAVPFYRGGDYLSRALRSIFAQPDSSWVAMVVDNSSDKREREAVQRLVRAYPRDRLRYVRNETHLTACENFNRCIDLAETDLISTVHGDDEVLPCYAQELLGLAARHPDVAVLFTAARIIDKDSRPRFSFVDWFKQFLMPRGSGDLVLHGEDSLNSLARGDWINGAAVCYRKSILGDLRWDSNYPMASDLELWSRVILAGKTMAGTRYPPAYSYRRHADQTTARLGARFGRFYEESLVLEIIADRAAARGWASTAKTARRKAVLQLHLAYLIAYHVARGSLKTVRVLLTVLRDVRRIRLGANLDAPRALGDEA